MVCFQSEYLHIEYHEPDKILISQWYGTCTSLQYRQALQQSVQCTITHNVNFAIVDRRLLSPLSAEDLKWTSENYLRALYQLPLKRFAILNPFNVEADQQQQRLMQAYTNQLPFEIRSFDDLTSAYDWLMLQEA